MPQNASATSVPAALTPIQQLRQDLNARFPERREVIDGALCAVLAGEHVLRLGPPGTAKSALVRSIAQAFGGSYFERLLTNAAYGKQSVSGDYHPPEIHLSPITPYDAAEPEEA